VHGGSAGRFVSAPGAAHHTLPNGRVTNAQWWVHSDPKAKRTCRYVIAESAPWKRYASEIWTDSTSLRGGPVDVTSYADLAQHGRDTDADGLLADVRAPGERQPRPALKIRVSPELARRGQASLPTSPSTGFRRWTTTRTTERNTGHLTETIPDTAVSGLTSVLISLRTCPLCSNVGDAADHKAPTEPSPRPVGTLLANSQANAVAVTTPLPAVPLTSRPPADEPPTARAVEPRIDQQARLEPPAPPVAERPRAIEALSSEEVLSLRKRGQDLLSVGDIASARLILTRLAEAGDADATLMLAGTFDATVLAGLHVVGIRPDPAKAHEWYMRAAELGSSEARLRLQQSARR